MIFDKAYVISLEHRQDKLDQFLKGLPEPWILGDISVFTGINGKKSTVPPFWKSGKGAWGCYQSHLNIIKECYNDPTINNVLIFEDDAIFCEDFNSKASQFLKSLPDNWGMCYMGGQHLKMPKQVLINDCVSIGTNINRTHAYAINSKSTMKILISWLNNLEIWKPGHHIDHHYGRLHEASKVLPYCPLYWLVGQRQGVSDITNKKLSTRWWG